MNLYPIEVLANSFLDLSFSDLARNSQNLLSQGLDNPGPLTLILVFSGGLLTSLGPCSLSLLPVTIAYLAGFETKQTPTQRSLFFCSGIVLAFVLLGSLSGLIGRVYGQLPLAIPTLVAVLAIIMGLYLLGFLKVSLPQGPDPEFWKSKVPTRLAPITAGFAFGLAATPCTTPVLAVLLGWIAQKGSPLVGITLLMCFGLGQVVPLMIAGTAAANIPNLMKLRPLGSWISPLSGLFFLVTGLLSLLARWV